MLSLSIVFSYMITDGRRTFVLFYVFGAFAQHLRAMN